MCIYHLLFQHLNQLILSSRTGFTLTVAREWRYRRY